MSSDVLSRMIGTAAGAIMVELAVPCGSRRRLRCGAGANRKCYWENRKLIAILFLFRCRLPLFAVQRPHTALLMVPSEYPSVHSHAYFIFFECALGIDFAASNPALENVFFCYRVLGNVEAMLAKDILYHDW